MQKQIEQLNEAITTTDNTSDWLSEDKIDACSIESLTCWSGLANFV